MKLLIGYDGSEQGRDALALGAALARLDGADVIVGAVLSHDPFVPDPRPYEKAVARDSERLSAQAAKVLGDVDFAMRAVGGASPPGALDSWAADEDSDYIVLGSTHRGALGQVLPGGVGERLLAGAPCAVVIAPHGFADRPHAGIGVIGAAYDGGDEASRALREAASLAARLGADLRVLTVAGSEDAGPVRARARSVLSAGETWGVAVDHIVLEGDPAAVLAEQGVELDLLVIGSRGYGPVRRVLLGGVSGAVMRTAPCPVVVVPRASGDDA
jgi:nucleotide-binding universal stress UspA family protein